MKNLLLIIGCAVIFYSCDVQGIQRGSLKTTREMAINGNVTQIPVVADLDVKPKDSATLSFSANGNMADMKNEVVALLLNNHKADVLVSPSYDIETLGNRTTVTVYGYPATYKNFRSAKPSDTSVIGMYRYMPYNNAVTERATTGTPHKMKGVGWIIAGSVVLLIAVLAFSAN